MLLNYHKEQKKYKEKSFVAPKKKSNREEETLAMLAKFKNKLSSFPDPDDDTNEKETKNTDADDDDDDISGDNWMKNRLKFENNDPVLAKDASTKDDDWFDIYDPRNPINKRRREQDAQDGRKREKDRMRRVI